MPRFTLHTFRIFCIICWCCLAVLVHTAYGVMVFAQTSTTATTQPPALGSRCADPILLCQIESIQTRTDSTFLTETAPALPCVSSTATAQIRNAVWYKIRIHNSGNLGFMLRPLTSSGRTDTEANYDWAIFRLTDSTRCGTLGAPILCNTSPRGGLTGASGVVIDERGILNPNFTPTIPNVREGEEYLVFVMNPSNHRTGFVLDLGFSSSPDVVVQPEVNVSSISVASRVCLTNTITVKFSDLVRVSSVVPQAFRFESERGVERPITLVSAQRFGIASSSFAVDAFDSVFTFQFNDPINQTELYRLRVLRDIPSLCGVLPAGTTIATVLSVGPRLEIRGLRAYCSGDGARLTASSERFAAYLWTNLATGRTISTSSTAIAPEGDYRLVVVDNNGCIGESVATVRSTSAVTLVLNPSNSRGDRTNRFCNFPDGRDYILLQTSPDFDRYEWVVNGVVTTGTVSERYVFDAPGRYQVRAFANGCMTESNVVDVQMFPPPVKPEIRQIGNYLGVMNRVASSQQYYWVRLNRNGSFTGQEFGYEFSPAQSGVYAVQIQNEQGCVLLSDTLNFIQTPVRVRLSTGSYQANHARPFDMRFTATNLLRSLRDVGATTLTFTVRMDGRVLAPSPSVQPGIIAQTSSTSAFIRRVQCSWQTPALNVQTSSIGTLRMLGLLHPSTATSVIALENAFCLTPSGKRINGVQFELETNASFRISNVPPGFFSTSATLGNELGIHEAKEQNTQEQYVQEQKAREQVNISLWSYPNPTNDNCTLRLTVDGNTSAETSVNAWLQDKFGRIYKRLIAGEKFTFGTHERRFSLADVPEGAYVLVVQTPNHTHSLLLSLQR